MSDVLRPSPGASPVGGEGARDHAPRGWTRAYVALGSNRGDRRRTLDGAVAQLAADPRCRVRRTSRWIETAPVGGPSDQRAFYNGALELDTTLDAAELLALLLAVEARFGRDRAREVRNGPRTLDLDLIVFGDETIDEPALTVPHPRFAERLFVLAPLAELVPELVPPGHTRTIAQLASELGGVAVGS